MCTAISYKNVDAYFGRNLDLERGYGECVVITPRQYEFTMRYTKSMTFHYAMIGMATVVNEFPLYYEATNEKGLSMAGLNSLEMRSIMSLIMRKKILHPSSLFHGF